MTAKVAPGELAALIAAGLRVEELARALGVHRASVHRAAKRHGLALPKRPRRLPRTADEMKGLIVDHGLSPSRIAAALGIKRPQHVRDLMVEMGLLRTWFGIRGSTYAEWTEL